MGGSVRGGIAGEGATDRSRKPAGTWRSIAPSGRVTSVDLLCATYKRRIGSSLFAELFDRDGNPLACRMIARPEIADNTYHPFILGEDLALEPGAKYRLVVSSIGGAPDDCIGIWVHACAAGDSDYANVLSRSAESGRSYTPRTRPCRRTEGVRRAALLARVRSAAGRSRGMDGRGRAYGGRPAVVAAPARYLLGDLVSVFAGVTGREDFCGPSFDELCFELHRRGVATLFYQVGGLPSLTGFGTKGGIELSSGISSRRAAAATTR